MKHQPLSVDDHASSLTALTGNATGLGREIVEISAFLAQLDGECHQQDATLSSLVTQSSQLETATRQMLDAVIRMSSASDSALQQVRASTAFIAEGGEASRGLAEWVNDVNNQGETMREMLQAVQMSNTQISDIASQVTILAVNAKIEAARAGQAGKGFSIVADSVNELSQKTAVAAQRSSETVRHMADWLRKLQTGAAQNSGNAARILERSAQSDDALTAIETEVGSLGQDTQGLSEAASRAQEVVDHLGPALSGMCGFVRGLSQGVEAASQRCFTLVDVSEEILQHTVALGGDGADMPMISMVQALAGEVAQAFETALAQGRTDMGRLFDTTYRPIPGSDPQQVLTAFTELTDRLLPPIQEPVLEHDPRIVFCAAVDRNGYLPTHNLKFAHPPSDDPVWNAANCRNRRIFDDRVGLKAGRNERPFLLQVYRRDMGGGQFVMMKDLSAPIRVRGRHWGGLRLAYKF